MDVITYSLRDGQARSDRYYRDVAAFTDEVLAEADGRLRSRVEAFRSYLEQIGAEPPRGYPEYTLELLALGVLWRVYAAQALGLPEVPPQVLTGLVRLRRRRGGCHD